MYFTRYNGTTLALLAATAVLLTVSFKPFMQSRKPFIWLIHSWYTSLFCFLLYFWGSLFLLEYLYTWLVHVKLSTFINVFSKTTNICYTEIKITVYFFYFYFYASGSLKWDELNQGWLFYHFLSKSGLDPSGNWTQEPLSFTRPWR